MSLAIHVWPAVVNGLKTIIGVDPVSYAAPGAVRAPLRGLSEGEQDSVPESPWAWLVNSQIEVPKITAGDLNPTTYLFQLRLLADWTNDSTNAEHILLPLIEQVRQIFQAHTKLGTTPDAGGPHIASSAVRAGDWGYVPVNDIWYRSADLLIEVVEKEIRNVGI